jgi:hypothetical protein
MPAPPPEPPKPVDRASVEAASRTKAQLAAAGGYGGTIATSGQGDTSSANVQGKTLLGA